MNNALLLPKDIRWLLKEKYQWSELQIQEVLQQLDYSQLSPEILADLKKLEEGEPLAYVIGWIPFSSLQIDLSLRPLIPRQETEYWVGEIIRMFGNAPPKTILDLGTGSGCIALSLARAWQNTAVDAADIELKAVQQTHLNAKKNSIRLRQVIQSNLFENISERYNLIVSNPPYVSPDLKLPKSVLFEPATALFADDQGLAVLSQILRTAAEYLLPNGHLVLEFSPEQAESLQHIGEEFDWHVDVRTDQFGRKRWAVFNH